MILNYMEGVQGHYLTKTISANRALTLSQL
jgi:hypothetical protein